MGLFYEDDGDPKTAGCLTVAVAFVFLSCGAVLFLNLSGEFGDKFGGLTSLFSGLGLVALIATLIYQKKELSQNTKALQAQQVEMEGQKEQLKKQSELIAEQVQLNKGQQLATRFFHSIEILQKMNDRLTPSEKPANQQFVEKMDSIFKSLINEHDRKTRSDRRRSLPKPTVDDAINAYEEGQKRNTQTHRSALYNCLYAAQAATGEQRDFFHYTLRSVLTKEDHTLMVYYALYDQDYWLHHVALGSYFDFEQVMSQMSNRRIWGNHFREMVKDYLNAG